MWFAIYLLIYCRRPSHIIRNVRNARNLSKLSQKPFEVNNGIILSKNMMLSQIPSRIQEDTGKNKQRPLALIFAWLFARENHLNRYRQLWISRGFDVLTVRTSLFDILLPPIGGRLVVRNLLKVLSPLTTQYNEIVVHVFSAGSYPLCETFFQMKDQEFSHLLSLIKGVIFDSLVFTQDLVTGLPKVTSQNTLIQSIIENSITIYSKLFHNMTIANFQKLEGAILSESEFPGLFLYSKDDIISSCERIEKFIESRIKCGHYVQWKCWDQSLHVRHYLCHQKEYEQQLDIFLKRLALKSTQNELFL